MQTLTAEQFKARYGSVGVSSFKTDGASTSTTLGQRLNTTDEKPTQSVPGTLLNPLREGVSGLKTLYGGGEQGIANKLRADVQAGAQDISQGNVLKGVAKAGLRTAGDVAGAVYAPIGAAIGATGVGRVFDKVGELSQHKGGLMDRVTDNPAVQKFAMGHPNAGEDFGRALSLAFAAREKGKIEPSTVLERTKQQFQPTVKINGKKWTLDEIHSPKNNGVIKSMTPKQQEAFAKFDREQSLKLNIKNAKAAGKDTSDLDAMLKESKMTKGVETKSVEQLRAEKVKSGYEEQNTRLKSVNNAFNKNTKTYKEADGTAKKVTPVDTLGKHNIVPEVEKGTINMGNYEQGTGALGKLKSVVEEINRNIDSKLVNTGAGTSIKAFKEMTIANIKKNSSLRETGKVDATIKKLDTVFNDYQQSYGEVLSNTEMNAIRKAMNKEWNPDTVDASRAVGDAARKIVYNATPDQAVKSLLQQQGEILSAKAYAEALNGTKVTGGRLGNMAMRTGGAIIGATVNKAPIVGPILGMLGGEYLARALQQTQFKSPVAEFRALTQRLSNKTQPSQSAKPKPNSDTIPKTVPPKAVKSSTPVDKLPNKEGGFIKNPFASNPPPTRPPTPKTTFKKSTIVLDVQKNTDNLARELGSHGKLAPSKSSIANESANRPAVKTMADDVNKAMGQKPTNLTTMKVPKAPKGSPSETDTYLYVKKAVKSSEAVNMDKLLKPGGGATRDMVYKGDTKILTPQFAEGRINDIAQKLNMYEKGLGELFKMSVKGKEMTLDQFVKQGTRMLEDRYLGFSMSQYVPNFDTLKKIANMTPAERKIFDLRNMVPRTVENTLNSMRSN